MLDYDAKGNLVGIGVAMVADVANHGMEYQKDGGNGRINGQAQPRARSTQV